MKITYGSSAFIITAFLCVLKAAGILTISWWWCFCLFWLPFAAIFAIIGLFAIIAVPFLIVALIIEILKDQ